MNNDDESTAMSNDIRLIDIIAAELKDLQAQSLKYRTAIETAKTRVKKDVYTRKLKKNNKKMMEMLVAFDKLRGKEVSTATDAKYIPEPERPEIPGELENE